MLLYCLKTKGDLNSSEFKIFSYLLSYVTFNLETMDLKDVVLILVNIRYMNSLYISSRDFKAIETIGTFVLDRIKDMDERSIYEFLKGNNSPPHSIYL